MNQNPYRPPKLQPKAKKQDGKALMAPYFRLVRLFVFPAIWVGLLFGAIFSAVTNWGLGLVFGFAFAVLFAMSIPAILLLIGQGNTDNDI